MKPRAIILLLTAVIAGVAAAWATFHLAATAPHPPIRHDDRSDTGLI